VRNNVFYLSLTDGSGFYGGVFEFRHEIWWKTTLFWCLYLRTCITDDPTHRFRRKADLYVGLYMVNNFSLQKSRLNSSCRGVITLTSWNLAYFHDFWRQTSIYIFLPSIAFPKHASWILTSTYGTHIGSVSALHVTFTVTCHIDIWSKTRKNALFHYFCRAISWRHTSISTLFLVLSTLIHIYNNYESKLGLHSSY